MANTFVHPNSTASIAAARISWNETLETILTHFYGAGNPGPLNFVINGSAPSSVPNGVGYRSSTTGALYIRDSARQVGNPVHGNDFTRNGIALVIEKDIAHAVSNLANYELCELFATEGANVRLYMKSSSNANTFVDVGLPVSNTITTAMIKPEAVTSSKIDSTVANTNGPQTLTGTQTITRDGQLQWSNSALIIKTTSGSTGNAAVTLSANGTSHAIIQHRRSANGIHITGSDGSTLANVECGSLIANSKIVGLSGVSQKTANYTIQLSDISHIIEMNVSSSNEVLIMDNANVPFPIGTTLDVIQLGVGTTRINSFPAVTVFSASSLTNLASQYSGASLYKRNTNEWVLVGNLQ